MTASLPFRVLITEAAAALLGQLRAQHGQVMFHQSGGCCDGSSPMCYPVGEFAVGDRDVLLGIFSVDGGETPVWISNTQFHAWSHTQLVIDVVPGRGAGFSLEAPHGVRFLSRGRIFTDAEQRLLSEWDPLHGADYMRGERPPHGYSPVISGFDSDACSLASGRAPHLKSE
ncbi:DUF779 domain-containing protein [Mycolicibacterium sp. 120322]